MKKQIFICLFIICIFMCGCGKRINYDLPENPIVFKSETYVNENDSEDTYAMLEYNGRQYVPYGTLKNRIDGDDTDMVLGYEYNENFKDDKNGRVLSLKGTEDYIMTYYVGGIMEQPIFYRAVDTMGKDIYTPDYIESFDYDIWKE